MEVDNDLQRAWCRSPGEEEAKPEPAGLVNGDVGGADAALESRIRFHFEVRKREDSAVERAVGTEDHVHDEGEEGDLELRLPWQAQAFAGHLEKT